MIAMADVGVLGPLCGTVGSVMASEAVKLITGVGEPLLGRVVTIDASAGSWRESRLRRAPHRAAARASSNAARRAGLARGKAAHRRAFLRLEAHDIGPEIGQEPPRIGGVIGREIENADSGQRGRGGWRLHHQSAPSNLSRNASQRFINRSWRL